VSLQVEAAALLGDRAAAEASMSELKELDGATGVTLFGGAAERARSWEMVAAGDYGGTAVRLTGLAHRLEEMGELMEAVRCLHDALRLGAPVAARLAQLARRVDGGLGRDIAIQADGLAAGDAALVEEAASGFAAAGCTLMAVDGHLQAAALWAHSGQTRRAASARERAEQLAQGCEGAVTPAMARASTPTRLTHREDQVARLAATGLTNREIADRLSTSVRTVEGHLQQAYMKLGISSRAALAGRYSSTGAVPR